MNLNDVSILVVDDEPQNVALLEKILQRAGYQDVRGTTSPVTVGSLCRNRTPDLILLDLHMPGMNGIEVIHEVKNLDLVMEPYIVVLTGDSAPETKNTALSHGARDFIAKPFDRTEVLLRIRNLVDMRLMHTRLQLHNLDLEHSVRMRTADLEEARLDIIARLGMAAEFRDDATGQHTRRVGALAAAIAAELGLEEDTVDLIGRAAPLHDVGKIAIPDRILLKPGPLDADEFAVMQTHTTIGAKLLANSRSPLLEMGQEIARSHHERWNGTGYPEKLTGTEIPISARIVAIADFYDALTHDRPYRTAYAPDDVRGMITDSSGSHFDPEIVTAFVRAL